MVHGRLKQKKGTFSCYLAEDKDQFAHAKHPIVGDRKYGRKDDRFARMALHAMHLEFDHPFSGRRMIFDSPVPESLLRLIRNEPKGKETGPIN